MIPGDTVDDMLSSVKLRSASSNRSALQSLNADQAVTSDASKQNFPRSMSLSEVNLEPDDQGDYIFEFFSHSTSHCWVKTQCVKQFWCGKPWPQFVEATLFSAEKKHAGGPSCQLGSSSEDWFSYIKASAGQSAASQPNCFFRAGCYRQ